MSLLEKSGIIWLDGEYLDWQQTKVHALNHTLHYGVGVFEGVRAYSTSKGTAIFRLQEHTNRFFNSAKILKMPVPYSKEELNQVQKQVINKNGLKAAYLRPLLFYGGEHLGLQPKNLSVHALVASWEWGNYFNHSQQDKGINVHTSSITRNHVKSLFGKAKACGHYVNSIMALQEALDCNCQEALLLDHNGFVAEGSSANVFIVRDGVLYTPTTAAILEGITRHSVMQLASDLGLKVVEKNLVRDDIYCADEMFFTGTAAEISPVSTVDGREIGDGYIGKITKELKQLYTATVQGENSKREEWLTYIA